MAMHKAPELLAPSHWGSCRALERMCWSDPWLLPPSLALLTTHPTWVARQGQCLVRSWCSWEFSAVCLDLC